MELVGQAVAYREEHEHLRLIFLCTNQERFDLLVSPAIKRIPPDLLVRAWTHRPLGDKGIPVKDNVLTHWEDL